MTEKKSNNRTWIWIVVVVAVVLAMICVCCAGAVAGLVVYKVMDRDVTCGYYGHTIPEMPALPEAPELPERDWGQRSPLGRKPFAQIQGGTVLTEIIEDSPAEAAGLLAGDVILAVDGRKLSEDYTLSDAVLRLEPGDYIEVSIWSHGRTDDLEIALGHHPDNSDVAWLGVYYQVLDIPDDMNWRWDEDSD